MHNFVSNWRIALLLILWTPQALYAQELDPHDVYYEILAREQILRADLDTQPKGAQPGPLLGRVRQLVTSYEKMAQAHPSSGYSDNALWQAALLLTDSFSSFGVERDRKKALTLLDSVKARFPSSSLNKKASAYRSRLKPPPLENESPRQIVKEVVNSQLPEPKTSPVLLQEIHHEKIPGGVRLTISLEREALFHEERLDGPPRVFIDLANTRAADTLHNATITYQDDVVKRVRIGDREGGTTRIVFDLDQGNNYSFYPLYSPYRLVFDFQRPIKKTTTTVATKPVKQIPIPAVAPGVRPSQAKKNDPSKPPQTVDSQNEATPVTPLLALPTQTLTPPSEPAANMEGGFSIARQLGLGISRIVIDPGHGGRDPGAQVKGLDESELVLDVALRLESLLKKQPNIKVVLTRRSNISVSLEERTRIANRMSADLFLSIHANASKNKSVRGVETYYLNFAQNPEAEALAARENAGEARTMTDLSNIVREIALNNKIDESRDFANFVQKAMFDGVRQTNSETRNLGVKQAPFMVLIGATMPSVLAEISFMTNQTEGELLKTTGYRQEIAEALLDGITGYQKALKTNITLASN